MIHLIIGGHIQTLGKLDNGPLSGNYHYGLQCEFVSEFSKIELGEEDVFQFVDYLKALSV